MSTSYLNFAPTMYTYPPIQTLNQLLKRRKVLTQIEVKFYLIQIINAVKHIHSRKIIHRDLKLGNFFLADGLEVKVGDFGLATRLSYEGERRKTICGTPNYIAPEVLEGIPWIIQARKDTHMRSIFGVQESLPMRCSSEGHHLRPIRLKSPMKRSKFVITPFLRAMSHSLLRTLSAGC